MYIIISIIYTPVQSRQTYTITIQNVYNYMYNIYNGKEKTNIYNNNTKCILLYVKYIQQRRQTYTITMLNVYNYRYHIYNGIEKTNIYNNNTKYI